MIKKGTFEDFATQEITVEKELPKTLEEFAIKEIQNLRKEKKTLEESLEFSYKREADLIQERDEYKNRFIEFISRLKEDLKPKIKVAYSGDKYIHIETYKLWENSPESYEYYKELFNLKEECEEDEPEKETIKS